MTEEPENCDIGIITKTQCHLTSFTNKKNLYDLQSLSVEDISILKYRLDNYHEIASGKICEHHKCLWLTYYSSLRIKCFDPFKNHTSNITTGLRVLKLELCESALNSLLLKLKPGDKVCKRCETLLKDKIKVAQEGHSRNQIDSIASTSNLEIRRSDRIKELEEISYCDEDILPESQNSCISTVSTVSNISDFSTLSQEKSVVNTVLNSLDLPCMKDRPFQKTKRISDAKNIVHEVCKNFCEVFSKAANINIVVPETVSSNILDDCSQFRQVIMNLQQEFEITNSVHKKIECLSLLPKEWNKSKIQQYFDCTDYMYRKLNHFREMDGKF